MSVEVHEEAFTDTTMQDDPIDFGSLAGVKHNSVALDTTMQDDPVDFESLSTQGKKDPTPGITKRIYFFRPAFRRLVVVAGDAVANEVTEEELSFPCGVIRLVHTPEHWQHPEAEPEFWWGAFTPTCNPKVSFSESGEIQTTNLPRLNPSAISYPNRPPQSADEVVQAITEALASGEHGLARKLAMDGAEQYPTHGPLQKFAHVLAPPTVSRSIHPPRPGIKANRLWLKANREAYAGRWVALRDGHLLSTAHSFDDLIASVDDTTDVLLTKLS
jgi:hypothetical protein